MGGWIVYTQRSEDNSGELVLSLHHVSSGEGAQVMLLNFWKTRKILYRVPIGFFFSTFFENSSNFFDLYL